MNDRLIELRRVAARRGCSRNALQRLPDPKTRSHAPGSLAKGPPKGPFCHANTTHSSPFAYLTPRPPFSRWFLPSSRRYPRRAYRPGVRFLSPEEFLGTLCHPIATEGSCLIHDSTTEKTREPWQKGGRARGSWARANVPVEMASVTNRYYRVVYAVTIVVSPCVRRSIRERDFITKKLKSSGIFVRPVYRYWNICRIYNKMSLETYFWDCYLVWNLVI